MNGFQALKFASFAHSIIYACLLYAALTDAPTLVLGWMHGLGWILMSVACLAAVRLRVIPLRVALAVVVLGGVGPFFGSIAFVAEERRRKRVASAS